MDEIRNTILKVEALKADKKFAEAIALLQKTLVKYSDDYRLYEELADIYLYIGDNEKAFSALDFSLTLNDKSATGNYLKGFILLGEDKVSESISYLEKSNALFGNNAEVLRNLGWAYTMSGQHERGITILKRALNISPEDELITEDLAMALIGTGDISAGNRLLKKIGKSTNKS
ncbi:hypothetical protein LR010_00600 [Candidatus Gracilibacteria bacterium]|nr:hypothetical protein [Candidatus Gracilibacteria bacterium]